MEQLEQNFAIYTENLSKRFDAVEAVKRVNLRVSKREIYALIGPNGAGKTTLIKILVGLHSPSAGLALIFGKNIVTQALEAKKSFGYISDNPTAYDYLTGMEFLSLTGNLRDMPPDRIKERIKELANLFSLKKILPQRMASYSRGNRQKVAFLACLISEPPLLIIDEPIAGLDTQSIRIFGQTLQEFARSGGAVFFATHSLSFGEQYAHRVGIMDEGKMAAEEKILTGKSLEKLYKKITVSS